MQTWIATAFDDSQWLAECYPEAETEQAALVAATYSFDADRIPWTKIHVSPIANGKADNEDR